jgi:hypothetical protein
MQSFLDPAHQTLYDSQQNWPERALPGVSAATCSDRYARAFATPIKKQAEATLASSPAREAENAYADPRQTKPSPEKRSRNRPAEYAP